MWVRRGQDKAVRAHLRCCRTCTYSDCSEDILQLVHEGDQARVVDVDAITVSFEPQTASPDAPRTQTYALGFVAMVGDGCDCFELRRQYAHERVYVRRGKLSARAPMAGVFRILGVECGLA